MGIIEPKDFGGDISNFEDIRSNKWFSLKKIKPYNLLSIIPIFNKINYVIVLNSDPPKIIAEDDNIDQINEDWNWAHSIMQKDMSYEDFIHYLEGKAIAIKQFNEELKKKVEEKEIFHQAFGFSDSVICKYRCSSIKTGPMPGMLYITNYCISFSFTFNINTPIILRYKDISTVEKIYVLNLMKAIKITDNHGNIYTFTAFHDRDHVYNIINYLWYNFMESILQIEEVNVSKALQRKKKLLDETHNDVVVNNTADNLITFSQKQLRQYIMTMKLIDQFRYPKSESVHFKSECSLKLYSPSSIKKYIVIVTENFLSFINEEDSHIKATIPFFDITALHYDYVNTIKIFCPCITAEVIIEKQKKAAKFYNISETFFNMSKKLFKHVSKNAYLKIEQFERTRQLVSLTRDQSIILNQNNSFDDMNWSEYCFNFFEGFSLIYDPSFTSLIEKGILHSLRGIMWQIYSGSMYHKIIYESKGYYKKLLQKSEELKSKCKKIDVFEDIEKDLQRSFPEHPFYQTEEGINVLRNVLIACALHNENIGYCQSMNIICSILLLYMNEESAFYLMNVICDIIMKRNFSKSMSGSVINQMIFEKLLKLKLPRLQAHLKSHNVPIKAIIMPWLLCLFVDCLPLDTVLRIFDLFFLYGMKALFQAGLAIFYLKEDVLLKINDSYDITHILREDIKIQSDLLINTMKEKFSDVDDEIILKYKLHCTHKHTRSITESWKKDIFKKVVKQNDLRIPFDIFNETYNSYIDIVKHESDELPSLNDEQYLTLMNKFDWFMRLDFEEKHKILCLVTRDKDNKISFDEIFKNLHSWIYSGKRGKFNLCLILKGYIDSQKLYYNEIVEIIDILFRIENVKIDSKELAREMMEDFGYEMYKPVDIKIIENYICSSIINDE